MPSKPASVLGPYRLLEPLGRGGMGTVWRAEHCESGQRVALKMLNAPNEVLLSSLRREIRALARIRHPGIVRILDEGIHEGLPWYAMELLEGRTLRWFCSRPRAVTATEQAGKETHDALAEAATDAAARDESTHAPSAAGTDKPEALEGSPVPGVSRLGSCAGARPCAVPEALRTILTLVRRLCAPLIRTTADWHRLRPAVAASEGERPERPRGARADSSPSNLVVEQLCQSHVVRFSVPARRGPRPSRPQARQHPDRRRETGDGRRE
jgi:hypothetical protein